MTTLQVGVIVSWNAPKEPVAIGDLRVALMTHGFDVDLAKDMAPRNAFSRAIKDLNKERIIRRAEEDEDKIKFQFTREALVDTEFEYTKECDLYVDKSSGCVTGTDAALAIHAESLLRHHMGIRISGDITRLVQKIFANAGGDLIPIREQGGVYFVPQTHADLVARVGMLLNAVGGKLKPFHLNDSEETKQSVASDLTTHLLGLIEDFKRSIDSLSKETNPNVIERRIEVANELRGKMDAYRFLLSGYLGTIEDEMKAAEDLLIQSAAREAVAA